MWIVVFLTTDNARIGLRNVEVADIRVANKRMSNVRKRKMVGAMRGVRTGSI